MDSIVTTFFIQEYQGSTVLHLNTVLYLQLECKSVYKVRMSKTTQNKYWQGSAISECSFTLPLPPKVDGDYVYSPHPSLFLRYPVDREMDKQLWTDSDETWWTDWVCDKDEFIDFGVDVDPDPDTSIFFK